MNVLIVEPFHSGSHRVWAEGYVEHSRHQVRLATHPGRWWKWRMRGSAVTLAESLADLDGWMPDLVVVSGMTDLAQFRTFARRFIGDVPALSPRDPTHLPNCQRPAGGHVLRDDQLALGGRSRCRPVQLGLSPRSLLREPARAAVPFCPHRLSYPWLIPEEFHDLVLYPDGGLLDALGRALEDPLAPRGLADSMHRFSWDVLAPEYDRRLADLVEARFVRGPDRPSPAGERAPPRP